MELRRRCHPRGNGAVPLRRDPDSGVSRRHAVFARGIGEETDIVGKEMYTFVDKGGSSLTLRPEMTAPVIRSFVQHSLGEQSALNKLYYIGPMFRQERPQAGRFRQFHQFGFECIGQSAPECDAEIIAMARRSIAGSEFTIR
jgi:histidyl-tRNA synthetase